MPIGIQRQILNELAKFNWGSGLYELGACIDHGEPRLTHSTLRHAHFIILLNCFMRQWCSAWPFMYNTITIDTRNEDVVNQEVPPALEAKNGLCTVLVLRDFKDGNVSSLEGGVVIDHLTVGTGMCLDCPYNIQKYTGKNRFIITFRDQYKDQDVKPHYPETVVLSGTLGFAKYSLSSAFRLGT